MDKLVKSLLQDANINIENLLESYSLKEQEKVISKALKECRTKIKEAFILRKTFLNQSNYVEATTVKYEVKRLKQIEEKMVQYKRSLYENMIATYTKTHIRSAKGSFEDSCYRMIVSCFPNLDEDLKRLHEQYLREENSFSKKELLLKMKNFYIEVWNKVEIERKLFISKFVERIKQEKGIVLSIRDKKQIEKYLECEEYSEEHIQYQNYKMHVRKQKICLENINKLIELYDKSLLKQEKRSNLVLEEYEVDYSQYFEKQETVELVEKYLNDLQNQEFSLISSLGDYILEFQNFLDSLMVDENILFNSIYLRQIKLRIRREKENKNIVEISVLEELKNIVKKKLRKLTFKEEKTKDYYYHILLPFLNSNYNYAYIKRFLQENENFINARDSEHIILEIIDRYILNMKLKCVNQGLGYIDPEYYYQLYFLFFQKYNPLNEEEKEKIKERLEEFYHYILDRNYKEKDFIIKQIGTLSQMSFGKKEALTDELVVQKELDALSYKLKDSLKSNRVDLTYSYLSEVREMIEKENFEQGITDKEKAARLNIPLYDVQNSSYIADIFMLENGKYSYSLQYDDEGNTLLKIHMLDTRSFIETPLENKMKEEALKGRRYSVLNFEQGLFYPTITYQLKIYSNNEIGDFKYYPSRIQVNHVYSKSDIASFREVDNLRRFISTLKKISLTSECVFDSENIELFLESVLSEKIMELSIPFVYVNNREILEDMVLKSHYEICHLLMHISKEESNQINKILKSDLGNYYSTEKMDNSYIIVDSMHYLGIFLQRILMHIYRGREFIPSELEEIKEEVYHCVEYLNQNIGYIPFSNKRNYQYRK